MTHVICCTPKHLPDHLLVPAAETARGINPVNAPPPLARAVKVKLAGKLHVPPRAVMTTKWWGSSGVNLTVGFMDNPKIRILHDAGGYDSDYELIGLVYPIPSSLENLV